MTSSVPRSGATPWLWLTIFLFHFAFFLSGYVQEDAFITFRTGFNLADHGVYSYNVDEHYPGATSLLYGYYTAGARLLFGAFAINAIGLLNLVYCCVAGWLLTEALLATSLLRLVRDSAAHQALLFVACTAPALLRASGSGMETPLLILLMAMSMWSIQRQYLAVAALCVALLPFVRIDALSFGLICAGVVFMGHRKQGLLLVAALAMGMAALLAANHASFGAYIPLTAEAKQAAYHPARDLVSVAHRLWAVFVQNSYVPGVSSKFIPVPVYALIALVYLGVLAWVVRHVLSHHLGEARRWQAHSALLIMAASSLLVPLAYAYGGVVFPWYLWPASVMAVVVIAAATLQTQRASLRHGLVWGVALANVFNIVIHLSIASQEAGYRAAVGNHLRRIAPPNATVFLEPAGYIPFFADIKAYDTIGLASGKVMAYRKQSETQWWITFLKGERPTFVLERRPVHIDGVMEPGVPMSPEDLTWFKAHYRLNRHFIYSGYLDENRSVLTPILRLGHHADYYVYEESLPIVDHGQ